MEKDPKGTSGVLGGVVLEMTGFFAGIALWIIYGWKLSLTGIPVIIIGIIIQNYGHRKNEQQ